MKSLRYWAIKYAEAGFRVFPLEPNGKGPLGSSKDSPFHADLRRPLHGFKDATTDTKQVNAWWKRWPNANIGICPPSGIGIIDIDPRNGGVRAPMMVPTLESVSGRGDGGGHLFYKDPPDHLPDITGIDIITTGGYVVAPPSIHPDSGLPYKWVGKFDPAGIQPWPVGLVPPADKPLAPKLNGAHQPLAPSQVGWCLERISADEEPDCFKVVRAVKADYPDEGRRWCKDWVATTTKNNLYKEAEFNKLWERPDRQDGELVNTRTLKFDAEKVSGEKMPGPTHAEAAEEFGAEVDIFDETPRKKKKSFFPILSVEELLNRPRAKWLIKYVLPETGTALIFGASQSGKTFLALDMVAAIVGKATWGREQRRVRNGKVIYVAAEGAGGFRNRVEALVRRKNDLSNLHVVPVSLQISEDKAVAHLIQDIRNLVGADGVSAIVFDTLSQVMAGVDENQSMMGIALKAADKLRAEFNCLVIFIGHSGKDPARGHRGWSGISANVDTTIEVVESNSIRTATIRKQRDGESGVQYSFVLKPVTIGEDEDGDPITTCVLEYCDTPTVAAAPKRPDGNIQTAVYNAIKTGLCEVPAVIAESIKGIKRSEGKDRRREYARRALEKLVANQVVIQEGSIVRLPS